MKVNNLAYNVLTFAITASCKQLARVSKYFIQILALNILFTV